MGDEPAAGWTLDQHLLAAVVDSLAVANWQRQGKKGAKRPSPISPLAKGKRGTGDSGGRTQQDIDGLLRAMRTGVVGG